MIVFFSKIRRITLGCNRRQEDRKEMDKESMTGKFSRQETRAKEVGGRRWTGYRGIVGLFIF